MNKISALLASKLRQATLNILAIACSLTGLTNAPAHAADTLQFGVFPYLPPAKLQALFAPIAADLEKALGIKVELSSRSEYATFSEGLRSQTFDIAFIQPFDYPAAHDKYNYLPIARRGESLEALIIVLPDSPIKTIKDLKGKVIANPPSEAAVSYLTSMSLLDASIDPIKSVKREFGKSHFSCMQSVLVGAADACGTADQALMHFEKEKQMTAKFRVLHRTPPVAHSLFVIHKRVPTETRARLQSTILNWQQTEAGRKIIENGQFIPFVAAQDKDYQTVRNAMRRISH